MEIFMTSPMHNTSLVSKNNFDVPAGPITRSKAATKNTLSDAEPVGLLAVSKPWTQVFPLNNSKEAHLAKFEQLAAVIEKSSPPAAPAELLGQFNVKAYNLSDAAKITLISMLSIVSRSSALLTQLLDWRNPTTETESTLSFVARVVTTEAALIALPIAAVIESVAYSILSFGTYVLGKDESHRHNMQLLKSSSFTIAWAAADLLFYNMFCATLPTNEWDAWDTLVKATR
jgi:hypothetical protein